MLSAVNGKGVFAAGSPAENVLSIQLFLLVVAVSMLSLATLIAENAALTEALTVDVTDRSQAMDALRVNQERYAVATAAGAVGVWDWNFETGEIYVDPTLKAILGFADAEISDARGRLGFPHSSRGRPGGDGAGAGLHRGPHRRVRSRTSDDPQGRQRAVVPLARIAGEASGRHAAPHGRDEGGHHPTEARAEERMRENEAVLQATNQRDAASGRTV